MERKSTKKVAEELCALCNDFVEQLKERDRQLDKLYAENQALYRERAEIVVAFARAMEALGYKIGLGFDAEEPEWPVLFIEAGPGRGGWQMSWHIRKQDVVGLASGIGVYDGKWDGHTTEEKYERLRRWRP